MDDNELLYKMYKMYKMFCQLTFESTGKMKQFTIDGKWKNWSSKFIGEICNYEKQFLPCIQHQLTKINKNQHQSASIKTKQ